VPTPKPNPQRRQESAVGITFLRISSCLSEKIDSHRLHAYFYKPLPSHFRYLRVVQPMIMSTMIPAVHEHSRLRPVKFEFSLLQRYFTHAINSNGQPFNFRIMSYGNHSIRKQNPNSGRNLYDSLDLCLAFLKFISKALSLLLGKKDQ
jgi:hypothetical protein